MKITRKTKRLLASVDMVEQRSFSFSEALNAMRNGHAMVRMGWTTMGILELRDNLPTIQGDSVPIVPQLYVRGKADNLFLWIPNQLDILAEDWFYASK